MATILRGLRAGALYELRVDVFTRFGSAPLGRTVTARTPSPDAPPGVCIELFKVRVNWKLLEPGFFLKATPKVWSFGRIITASDGGRVRLRCGAEGAPPLQRHWAPLPAKHSLSDDDGDLLLLGECRRLRATVATAYDAPDSRSVQGWRQAMRATTLALRATRTAPTPCRTWCAWCALLPRPPRRAS